MSITTITTAPNPVSEIQVPFMIDPSTGMVNSMSDPVQIAIQAIISLCMTIPGERVMNPSYGVGIQTLLFENSDSLEFQAVAVQIQNQLAQDTQDYFDASVTITENPALPGSYVFSVSFEVYGSNQVHYVIFDYAGNVIGES